MKAPHTILALMEAMLHVEKDVIPVIRSSKHAGGHRRPRGWHQKLRARRKAERAARRAHRRG